MSRYFPIYINLAGKKVWVYGAGRIALRRVTGLLRFGASVTVIAPEICEEIRALQAQNTDQAVVLQRIYQSGEIPKGVERQKGQFQDLRGMPQERHSSQSCVRQQSV